MESTNNLDVKEPVQKMEEGEREPTILNFIMLGTNEHSQRVKTVLTQLESILEVSDKQSVHVINGVGGVAKKGVPDPQPMLGTYDFRCDYDPNSGKITSHKTQRSASQSVDRRDALISGEGFKDAINEMKSVIDAMLKVESKRPLVINFFGFSRGADINLYAINELKKHYSEDLIADIHVVSIDHVPGPWRDNVREARLIPDNVSDYQAVLMEDDDRSIFAAQDKTKLVVQDPVKTNLDYTIYHGMHNDAARFTKDPYSDENKTNDSGILLWDFVQRFANKYCLVDKKAKLHYTQKGEKGYEVLTDKDPLQLDDLQRLQTYARMQANVKKYRDHNPAWANARREFVGRKRDYFWHGYNVFQDKYHMKLFKKQFPAIFDVFFQQNLENQSVIKIETELQNLINYREEYPDLFKFVEDKILKESIEKIKIEKLEAQGIYIKVDDFYSPDHPIRMVWENIYAAVAPILAGYEKGVSVKELLDNIFYALTSNPDESSAILNAQEILRSFYVSNRGKNYLLDARLAAIISVNPAQVFATLMSYLNSVKVKDKYINEMQNLKKELATYSNVAFKEIAKAKTDPIQQSKVMLNLSKGFRGILWNYAKAKKIPKKVAQDILGFIDNKKVRIIDHALALLEKYEKDFAKNKTPQDQLAKKIIERSIRALKEIDQDLLTMNNTEYAEHYYVKKLMYDVSHALNQLGILSTDIHNFDINYPMAATTARFRKNSFEGVDNILNGLHKDIINEINASGINNLQTILNNLTQHFSEYVTEEIKKNSTTAMKANRVIEELKSIITKLYLVNDISLIRKLLLVTREAFLHIDENTAKFAEQLEATYLQFPMENKNEGSDNVGAILRDYKKILNDMFPPDLSKQASEQLGELLNDETLSSDDLANINEAIIELTTLHNNGQGNNQDSVYNVFNTLSLYYISSDYEYEKQSLKNQIYNIQNKFRPKIHLGEINTEQLITKKAHEDYAKLNVKLDNYISNLDDNGYEYPSLGTRLRVAYEDTFYVGNDYSVLHAMGVRPGQTGYNASRYVLGFLGVPNTNNKADWTQYALLGFAFYPIKNLVKLSTEFLLYAGAISIDYASSRLEQNYNNTALMRNVFLRTLARGALGIGIGTCMVGSALCMALRLIVRTATSPIASFNEAKKHSKLLAALSIISTALIYSVTAAFVGPIIGAAALVVVGKIGLSKVATAAVAGFAKVSPYLLKAANFILPHLKSSLVMTAPTANYALAGFGVSLLVGIKGVMSAVYNKLTAKKPEPLPIVMEYLEEEKEPPIKGEDTKYLQEEMEHRKSLDVQEAPKPVVSKPLTTGYHPIDVLDETVTDNHSSLYHQNNMPPQNQDESKKEEEYKPPSPFEDIQ